MNRRILGIHARGKAHADVEAHSVCAGHLSPPQVTTLASGVHRTRSTGPSGTSVGYVSGRSKTRRGGNAQAPLLREFMDRRKIAALDELKKSLLQMTMDNG